MVCNHVRVDRSCKPSDTPRKGPRSVDYTPPRGGVTIPQAVVNLWGGQQSKPGDATHGPHHGSTSSGKQASTHRRRYLALRGRRPRIVRAARHRTASRLESRLSSGLRQGRQVGAARTPSREC